MTVEKYNSVPVKNIVWPCKGLAPPLQNIQIYGNCSSVPLKTSQNVHYSHDVLLSMHEIFQSCIFK